MTRELRRDVLLPLVILMAISILTSAGTTALLARMAPAIERIIAENLYSLEATEQMLAVLAGDDRDPSAPDRFAAALARAEGNLTEDREREHLAEISRTWPAALAGNREAETRAVESLLALGEVNRRAVVRSDEEARRLGLAGSWAAVFLGALSFAWALIAVRRARRRIIDPLHEIGAVLEAAHRGDSYRRCKRMAAPAEVETIMAGVDELLDARALRGFAEQPSLRAVVDRQILLHLLEQRPGPAWVITADGSIDAANQAGLEHLAGDGGDALRESLTAAPTGEASDLAVEPIAGTERFMCELSRS